jgi:hypothetical protein
MMNCPPPTAADYAAHDARKAADKARENEAALRRLQAQCEALSARVAELEEAFAVLGGRR